MHSSQLGVIHLKPVRMNPRHQTPPGPIKRSSWLIIFSPFGFSEIIPLVFSSPPSHFIWYLFMCSTLFWNRRESVVINSNIQVQFHPPTWNTIMFLRTWRAWERSCYWRGVKSNCGCYCSCPSEKESSHFKNTRCFQEDIFFIQDFCSARRVLSHQSIMCRQQYRT